MCFLIRREQPSTVTKPIGSVWKICVILGVTEFCFWVGLKKDKYSFETISFSLASQEKMNAKEVVCINWKKEIAMPILHSSLFRYVGDFKWNFIALPNLVILRINAHGMMGSNWQFGHWFLPSPQKNIAYFMISTWPFSYLPEHKWICMLFSKSLPR